jgi:DNA-binding transcriptional LysR family regulator
MDLRKLKSLMTVAELSSITEASKAVNLTQSAVSQQLKDLEEELGLKLIDRSRRPIGLTPEGVELVTVSRQINHLWKEFKDSHRKKEVAGQLMLGYIRSAVNPILAESIVSLKNRYPHVTIKLVNTGGVSKHLAQKVADKEIDASLGVGPLQLPKGVIWRAISLDRYYVVAPRRMQGKTFDELLSHLPYLRFKPYLLSETIIDRELNRIGLNLEAAMELDDYDSILLMVGHELGSGIVPEPYITRRILDELYCVPFGTPPLTRLGGLMMRYDNPAKHLVDLLWETLKELYNKQVMEKQRRWRSNKPRSGG